jgi:hypothetical protein
MTSNGSSREEADTSAVTAKCDFKWRTRPPKGYFKKLIEAACPHHPYSIMLRLMNYTMMKKFMTSRDPSSGAKPGRGGGGRGGKSAAPITGKVEVMKIFG